MTKSVKDKGKKALSGSHDKDIFDIKGMFSGLAFYESIATSLVSPDMCAEEQAEYDKQIQEHREKHDERVNLIWSIAKDALTPGQFECFYLYYCEDFRQEVIAKIMGIDQSRVVQLIKRSVVKITEELNEIDWMHRTLKNFSKEKLDK